MNFMQDRQEEQTKAETRARLELEKYHVECVSVLICQIMLPQELMDTQDEEDYRTAADYAVPGRTEGPGNKD